MKVVAGKPPIYDDIVRAIGRPPAGACFTWGDTLYAPAGVHLDPAFMEHEATHSRQQRGMGAGPWWAKYLESPEFRLEQEVEAYRRQYRFACLAGLSRQLRRAMARKLAGDLSGPMYGRIVSRSAALALISQ